VGAADGDAELDVGADIGEAVVDHGDHQDGVADQPQRVQLVAWQQPGGLLGIDPEPGEQRSGVLGVDRQVERDAVDERVPAALTA
jgi:hypothetical protein